MAEGKGRSRKEGSVRLFLPVLMLTLTSPALVNAQSEPASTAATIDPARAAAALKLAQLLNSAENIIGDDGSNEKAIALVKEMTAGNEEVVKLEREYPGVMSDIARAVLPIINRSSRVRLPQLWDRQAALYAANFNAGELGILFDFYNSPTGRKMVAGLGQAKPTAMVAEAAKSKDFAITAPSVLSDIKTAVPEIMKTFGPDDERELLKLMQSGLLARLKGIASQTQTVALDWQNESAPGEDGEIEKVTLAVIQKRIDGNHK